MIKKTYWRDDNFWICSHHLPGAKIPKQLTHCWYSNCTSQRPPIERPEKPCAWEKCNEGKDGGRAEARSKSKYCSINCKNKRARYHYNLRKKQKKSLSEKLRRKAYEQKA